MTVARQAGEPLPDNHRPTINPQASDAATRATAQRLERIDALCLCAVLAAYVVGYFWFLAANDFLPYVLDNNETFSSIVHAQNLYHFGLGSSLGLTDEAYGLDPAAHPYVYTHQGNFPRLYALVLYALGLRGPEGQIVVTTFTVGLAGLFFAYRFFAAIVTPAFAAVFCLLFMTDYVMAAQWQVNTWRVWHLFFFFSSLLCARGLGEKRFRIWVPLTALNFFALFYFELIFAAFTAATVGLYTGYLYWRRPARLAVAWLAQVGGALAGILLLIGQLVGYLGWDGFLQDLRLTFIARNFATSDADVAEALRHHVETNHIVFWYNLVDAADLRSLPAMVTSFLTYALRVYTPTLLLLTGLVCGVWLVSLAFAPRRTMGSEAKVWWRRVPELSAPVPPAWVAVASVGAFLVFAASVASDSTFAGLSGTDLGALAITLPERVIVGGFVLLLAVLLFDEVGKRAAQPGGLRVASVLAAIVFPLATAIWVRTEPGGDSLVLAPLWREMLEALGSTVVPQLAIIAAGWLAVRLLLGCVASESGRQPGESVVGLLPYLACGLGGFAIVFMLAPGYVMSGYFTRYAPFTVFVHLVPFALALYLLGQATVEAWRRMTLAPWFALRLWRRVRSKGVRLRQPWPGVVRSAAPLAVVAGALAFVVGYWGVLQATYHAWLPADRYAFLRLLREPPFRGASFVVNGYAAPVAVSTGQWAYYDPGIERAEVALTDEGIALHRDRRYLWLADRDHNAEYSEPDYFLCVSQAYLLFAIQNEGRNANADFRGCSQIPLVKQAREGSQPYLQHRLVAADESGRGRWAIVELDWDYPPFLRSLDARRPVVKIRAHTVAAAGEIGFGIEYEFAQQQGKAQAGAVYALYAVDGTDVCSKTIERTLLLRNERLERIRLPEDHRGLVQIGVAPRTATKTGPEYLSNILAIGGVPAGPDSCAESTQ